MPLNFDQEEVAITTKKWNRILITGVLIDSKTPGSRSITIQYQKQHVVNNNIVSKQEAEFVARGADFTQIATANCNGNWNLFRNLSSNLYQFLKSKLNVTGTVAVDN